jgi:hypothetical protein
LKTQIIKQRPVWIRVPKDGELCPWTGLSGAVLGYLVRPGSWNHFNPPVRTRRVTVRGHAGSGRYGSLLINLQSLLDYIDSCPDSKMARRLHTSARQAAHPRKRVTTRKEAAL